MTCNGIDCSTGETIEIEYGVAIGKVTRTELKTDVFLSPGWIDLQVNGYAGADYNSPEATTEEIARSLRVQFSCGVGRCLPTIITGPPADMLGALRNLMRAKEELAEGGAIEGFHIEGPHISPEDGPRGAHPKAWVRPPDLDEFARWQEAARGQVRLITLSPEWPQATRYIESIVAQGVVASIGHTAANSEQISEAVRAGATMSTHLGNGSHDILRRHPNYIWDQLAEDGLMAGLIADGIHLPAAFLKVALRAKGIERAVLVTDASSPAGCEPGRYPIGRQVVELTEDDRVVLAGSNRLAGSALRMHRGVENLMRLGGAELDGAIRMASINPARAVNIPGRTQGLAPGERADFTLFHFDPESRLKVVETIVGGRQVYP